MHEACRLDWNQLALAWDLFESRGLTPSLITQHVGSLRPPIAVVGCGRGLMLEQIVALHAPGAVTGFDASPEMVKQARLRGHLNVKLVEASQPLPADFSAGAVVLATGVLDPLEDREIERLLRFIRSRMQIDGTLLLTAFCQRNAMRELVREAQAEHPLGIIWQRLIDWSLAHAADPRAAPMLAWLNEIASRRACGLAAASEWLKAMLPTVRRLFDTAALSALTAKAGFAIVSAQEHDDAGVVVVRAVVAGGIGP